MRDKLIKTFAGIFSALLISSTLYAEEIVVNTAQDENNGGSECSLREAIFAAENNSAYGNCGSGTWTPTEVDHITFNLPAPSTIILSIDVLEIASSMIIEGPGANNLIIDGANNSLIFHIITNTAQVSISGLTLTRGSGGIAGAIYNDGILTLTNSVLTENTGAINNQNTLTVTNSIFDRNNTNFGGAIYNSGPLTIINSTFMNNIGSSFNTFHFNANPPAINTANIINSTIVASSTGPSFIMDAESGAVVNLKNTIIAGGDFGCIGSFTSQGNNLDQGNSCGLNANNSNPLLVDLINTDPQLTLDVATQLFFPASATSPVVDAGNCGSGSQAPTTDQLGTARPQNADCDIGAVELVVCGDGFAHGSETCDDGDSDAGDGCSATCQVEANYTCTGQPSVCTVGSGAVPIVCGNGFFETGEACDDGDTDSGDGCSDTCTVEPNYSCIGQPSICTSISGSSSANSSGGCSLILR